MADQGRSENRNVSLVMTVSSVSGNEPQRLDGQSDARNHVPVKVVNPILGQRLTAARKQAGLTQEELSKKVGLKQTSIAEIEAGRVRRPKKLREIARAVGSSEEHLLGEVQTPAAGAHLRFAEIAEVPMVGPVEAGVFRVVEDFDDAIEPAKIMAARDPRFPRARLYGFTVQGDSMDAMGITPGDIVIGMDFIDSGLPLRDGMVVVAEATRDGGHTIERTLKQIQTFRDRIELHPRSNNQKYRKFVITPNYDHREPTKCQDGTEIKILAVVLRVNKELPV